MFNISFPTDPTNTNLKISHFKKKKKINLKKRSFRLHSPKKRKETEKAQIINKQRQKKEN